jgi:hypothetical protein
MGAMGLCGEAKSHKSSGDEETEFLQMHRKSGVYRATQIGSRFDSHVDLPMFSLFFHEPFKLKFTPSPDSSKRSDLKEESEELFIVGGIEILSKLNRPISMACVE